MEQERLDGRPRGCKWPGCEDHVGGPGAKKHIQDRLRSMVGRNSLQEPNFAVLLRSFLIHEGYAEEEQA